MSPKSTVCVLPWMHLSTTPSGHLRVCCHSVAPIPTDPHGVRYPLTQDGLEEFWNGKFMRSLRRDMLSGKEAVGCGNCYRLEDNGALSPRLGKNAQYADLMPLIEATQDDGSAPINIAYVDLRLGNLCNLRCRMCGPDSSHLLKKEWDAIFPGHNKGLSNGDWAEDVSGLVGTLRRHLDGIRTIYLTGGEPTLVRGHEALLRAMVDSGVASRVILRYNTNATNFPSRFVDLWGAFSEVHVSMSIDAVGDLAHYIRYPSNWEAVAANIRRMDDLILDRPSVFFGSVTCTVQALNLLRLTELLDFVGGLHGVVRHPFFNVLHNPPVYDARVLPPSLKEAACERLLDWSARHPDHVVPWSGMSVQNLVTHVRSEDLSHRLPAFFAMNDAMDRYRGGMKLGDVLPELEAARMPSR